MYQHSVTTDALTDALVLMAIAMLLGRTGTLVLRKRSVESGESGEPAAARKQAVFAR